MPLPAGTHLGAYEILGLLGPGEMGEVSRARDAKLNRDVALKVRPDACRRSGATRTICTEGGGVKPRWGRGGRELFYWSAAPGNAGLSAAAIQPGAMLAAEAPRELFRAIPGTAWDVAPDGDHFPVELTGASDGASLFATVPGWFEECAAARRRRITYAKERSS